MIGPLEMKVLSEWCLRDINDYDYETEQMEWRHGKRKKKHGPLTLKVSVLD